MLHAQWTGLPSTVVAFLIPCTGGAGGRYTWGKLGEVYDDDGRPQDRKDPNYDSEEVSSGDGLSCHQS